MYQRCQINGNGCCFFYPCCCYLLLTYLLPFGKLKELPQVLQWRLQRALSVLEEGEWPTQMVCRGDNYSLGLGQLGILQSSSYSEFKDLLMTPLLLYAASLSKHFSWSCLICTLQKPWRLGKAGIPCCILTSKEVKAQEVGQVHAE